MGDFANIEGPDKIQHYAIFHQGLHCLWILKQTFMDRIYALIKNILALIPKSAKIDNTILIASICMGKSSRIQRVKGVERDTGFVSAWMLILPTKFCLIWFFTSQWTIFQLYWWVFLGWTSTKLGLMYLAQGHNAVTLVWLEPVALQTPVKQSTTELPYQLRPLLAKSDNTIMSYYSNKSSFFWKTFLQKIKW